MFRNVSPAIVRTVSVVSLRSGSAVSLPSGETLARFHAAAAPLLGVVRRLDPILYVLWSAALTIASARTFYGYMMKQTGGEWSAPLDDVFIHFDYARATAQGHPFEWTVGNGYSSGNTSLTYPFVLAVGWLLGFRERQLMVWAAIVAMTCVFGVLLAVRRLFVADEQDGWGQLSSYLVAPVFLGVGAFVWSLWSGMEVAFFLATWAIAFVAWHRLEACVPSEPLVGWQRSFVPRGAIRGPVLMLGAAGALLVTTRPEAALTIAAFGAFAALAHRRTRGNAGALGILLTVGVPAAVMLVLQSIANRVFTGEWSANGAIVKLATNNPYMTADDKVADYVFNLKYAALRNLDYHFASTEGERMSELVPAGWPNGNPLTRAWVHLCTSAWWAGVVPLVLGLLPLTFRRTRRVALLLWIQLVAWVVVVAFNGQVRWQNERYVMPAVGLLLILVALGVSVSLRRREFSTPHPPRPALLPTILLAALVVQTVGVLTRPAGSPAVFRLPWLLALGCGVVSALLLRPWLLRAGLVVSSLFFAHDHQIPKMRDQKWFFGRASRNIRDQHVELGKYLGRLHPNRVLVGDAGAILYESDLPGLDIIGLGGYHRLPFARAGVHGLPATIELIERLPVADRPEVLAIFPTWWGVLPVWFSSGVLRRFPVEGNVICGGYEQNAYQADWRLLGTGDRLRALPAGASRIVAEVDVGDLVSEKEHRYDFDKPSNGWTDMRVLPDPADETRDMFDGGRRMAFGKAERFEVKGSEPGRDAQLVVRSVPETATRVEVRVDGALVGTLTLERTAAWVEPSLVIPRERVTSTMRIELRNVGPGDFVDYHAWVTQ